MKIEDFWMDRELYIIEYIRFDGEILCKTMMFPAEMLKKEIYELVSKYFVDAKEICSIDDYFDVLFHKE
ncbi:hypothetical protein [Carnobacterium sp.]|uniref:hypothetical protein n=1 Tax=Carnobacterium sp. TaxID=48221 RepID=UPI002FC757D8